MTSETPERCIRLENGILLYPDLYAAPMLQKRAHERGFTDMRAFAAVHPDGTRTYLLAEGTEAVYENTSSEAVWSYIEMRYLKKTL